MDTEAYAWTQSFANKSTCSYSLINSHVFAFSHRQIYIPNQTARIKQLLYSGVWLKENDAPAHKHTNPYIFIWMHTQTTVTNTQTLRKKKLYAWLLYYSSSLILDFSLLLISIYYSVSVLLLLLIFIPVSLKSFLKLVICVLSFKLFLEICWLI